jgi:polar amino acid transport system substrate-binding protein
LSRILHIAALAAIGFAVIGADAPAPPLAVSAMFTAAQAHDGSALYAGHCAKCHAATLTGGSAPDLFGHSFTASSLSMGGLNQEITHQMPADDPGSLTAVQYATIIAYILAANCYPAGTTPYPTDGPIPNRTVKVATQGAATAPCTAP